MANSVLLVATLLIRIAWALQFLFANQFVGHSYWPNTSLAMDFTVYSPINVTSIGFFDADEPGINGTLMATIVDRSSGRFFVTVSASYGDSRENTTNPFHFASVKFVLKPGVYSLISTGFVIDRIIATGSEDNEAVISVTSSASVVATGALLCNGSQITSPVAVEVGGSNYFHVGATFTFDAVPVPPTVAFDSRDFVDCEAVACAGLPTGFYKVRGVVRFCDNDAQGGGWLRLWRANDSTCESNGWSSARNINAKGPDPFGCSPAVLRMGRCSNSTRIASPFAIGELRGTNWRVWGFGALDAFHSRIVCDGVVIRVAESNEVLAWALAASGGVSYGQCPCDRGFSPTSFTRASLNSTGAHWSCGRLPVKSSSWNSVFDVATNGSCTGATNNGDVTVFQRAFDVPPSNLVIGLCRNENDSTEEIKLANGDLFVRATIGFDKWKNCDVTAVNTTSLLSTGLHGEKATNQSAAPPFNDALIVAGSVGSVALVLFCAVVAFVCWKRKRGTAPTISGNVVTPVVTDEYGALPTLLQNNPEQFYDDVTVVRRTAVSDYEPTSAPL
jgi:hypothetical protein